MEDSFISKRDNNRFKINEKDISIINKETELETMSKEGVEDKTTINISSPKIEDKVKVQEGDLTEPNIETKQPIKV